jgi:hypothetical protein
MAIIAASVPKSIFLRVVGVMLLNLNRKHYTIINARKSIHCVLQAQYTKYLHR